MKAKFNTFLRKLNRYKFMPVIWLTLLAVIIWVICSLIHLPVAWRMGLIFFILNSYLAYKIGNVIEKHELSRWWLLFFPIIFAIAVTIHYAQYNYLLCVVYLCMELFGSWRDNFYREK